MHWKWSFFDMGNTQSISPLRPWQQFDTVLNAMDEAVKERILADIREVNDEIRMQEAVSRQLEEEIMIDIARHRVDGTTGSFLYQKLPPEIRHNIFSHLVAVDQSVHVFAPRGNENHGFRLSLCDESNYDFEMGSCKCEESRTRARIRPDFFDNAIFLVSQAVRREALDAFFMTNNFTFTCLYELVRFTSFFKRSSSKIQRLRILERVDDYPSTEYRVEAVQKARLRLQALKHLDLHIYICNWSAYESLYEDGLVHQLLHFALGPPPTEQKQNRKRKAACLDEKSESSGVDASDAQKDVKENNSIETSKETPNAQTNEQGEQTKQAKKTKQDFVLKTQLHTYGTLRPSEVGNLFPTLSKNSWGTSFSSLVKSTYPQIGSATASSDVVEASSLSFPIPPLRSFNAYIATRTHIRPLTPTDPKAAYYEALYLRLKHHLEDVFLDGGRRYRRIEDVPSLGPKPRNRQREEETPILGAEKRGLLVLKD